MLDRKSTNNRKDNNIMRTLTNDFKLTLKAGEKSKEFFPKVESIFLKVEPEDSPVTCTIIMHNKKTSHYIRPDAPIIFGKDYYSVVFNNEGVNDVVIKSI